MGDEQRGGQASEPEAGREKRPTLSPGWFMPLEEILVGERAVPSVADDGVIAELDRNGAHEPHRAMRGEPAFPLPGGQLGQVAQVRQAPREASKLLKLSILTPL